MLKISFLLSRAVIQRIRWSTIALGRDFARESPANSAKRCDPVSHRLVNSNKKISELKRMRQDETLCYFSPREIAQRYKSDLPSPADLVPSEANWIGARA